METNHDATHQRLDLAGEIGALPPDPASVGRHRARILVKDGSLRVVLVTMLQGAEMHDHAAPGPITVQPLAGAFDLTLNGVTESLTVGSLLVVEAGVPHNVICREDGAFLLTLGQPDQGV